MSFQSNFLRDGNWVTETVTVQDALKQPTAHAAPATGQHRQAPTCGILTKTVVESPIVRWTIPVRMRSNAHKDIAFIGSTFVQINELQHDGQIHEVLRKNDFGQRIRNAVAYGDFLAHELENTYPTANDEHHDARGQSDLQILDTDKDPNHLPPQFLVLFMESGDCLFMFLRENSDSTLEFVVSRHEKVRSIPWIGFHLAVDPSCRYLAAASPDGILEIFELEDWQTLNEKYIADRSFAPILRSRSRTIQGVIHKMEFLYPRPEDHQHIILVFIVMSKGNRKGQPGFPSSRLVSYEWEAGDQLATIFDREQSGTRLPVEHSMPLLIVPLVFRTSFLVVSADIIGVCKNVLGGSPEFEFLHAGAPEATKFHHGREEPLWTAWARPFRRKSYFHTTDIILVAREDGVVLHVEIDGKDLIPSFTTAGYLDTNVDTAFTASYDRFSDVIVVGGDSGPGGLWKLTPREDLSRVSLTPNWSPVIDVASTNDDLFWETDNPGNRKQKSSDKLKQKLASKPDSIFTASGRGLNGTVTQWRWGMQARIGLDIESGEQIRQSWAFATKDKNSNQLYGLLALPHSSLVLHFTDDLEQVQAVSQEDSFFDMSSTTVFALQRNDNSIVQVTESYITIVRASQSFKTALSELIDHPNWQTYKAFVHDDITVLSKIEASRSIIILLNEENNAFAIDTKWEAEGEVTALSIFHIASKPFILAAMALNGQAWIIVYALDGTVIIKQALSKRPRHEQGNDSNEAEADVLEPATSLSIVHQDNLGVVFVLGTRCGHLVSAIISQNIPDRIRWRTENLGIAAATVYPAAYSFNGGIAAFASCDGRLMLMTSFDEMAGEFRRKHLIFATDTNDLSMQTPPIHSMHSLNHSLTGYTGHMSLLLLSNSRLLLADIWPHVGQIPRTLFLNGTPSRIIYSHTWKCLIVGISRNDRPTLDFIDPETGVQIAKPRDKDGNVVKGVSGLGHSGDKIMGLTEWTHVKDGRNFTFLLVCTRDGHLLVISVAELDERVPDCGRRELKYWTRFRKVLEKPIYSIVGDNNGVAYCVGKTLHWDVLDLVEKKLKLVKTYQLDSPATSLKIVNGKIAAVTSGQSYQVFDHRRPGTSEMALIHSDTVSRRGLHTINAGDPDESEENWPITILSDDMQQVSGMWTPWDERDSEFHTVFKAKLASRIRKFVCARTRAPWLQASRAKQYGIKKSSTGNGEVLGISLDGSTHHLTLLSLATWRLFRFLENCVYKNEDLYDLTVPSRANLIAAEDGDWITDPDEYRDSMHVNGDFLQLCLEKRNLEEVLGTGDDCDMLFGCLDNIEDGRWTSGFKTVTNADERRRRYFALAYDVLEYALEPVL